MNESKNLSNMNRASASAIGFVAASLLFVIFTAAAVFSIHPPAIDADRDAVIAKAFTEMHASENTNLISAGWIDQSRGIVRLPIETAMQMVERNWQNSADARADLKSRVEKSSAPAPATPAKPSAFE
jgi:hypothetical protein